MYEVWEPAFINHSTQWYAAGYYVPTIVASGEPDVGESAELFLMFDNDSEIIAVNFGGGVITAPNVIIVNVDVGIVVEMEIDDVRGHSSHPGIVVKFGTLVLLVDLASVNDLIIDQIFVDETERHKHPCV
jgi:hypothetical protein